MQILALALHELATNARKHGALAVPQGRVAIRWYLKEDTAGCQLRIDWREYGTAAGKDRSRRKGFGRTLIEEALPYQLDAQTHLQFAPDGVFCSVTIRVDPGPTGSGR